MPLRNCFPNGHKIKPLALALTNGRPQLAVALPGRIIISLPTRPCSCNNSTRPLFPTCFITEHKLGAPARVCVFYGSRSGPRALRRPPRGRFRSETVKNTAAACMQRPFNDGHTQTHTSVRLQWPHNGNGNRQRSSELRPSVGQSQRLFFGIGTFNKIEPCCAFAWHSGYCGIYFVLP
jgi:hypothetical protein